ncbi:hypothetical protein LPY66_08580 [Dehalobacter sp. DCM]|uniref:prenylated flavin chaperone LpdD n=1 Tax=Dehalobacter sp. DCM TaxID=2907827 RepID=UPI00308200B8|nr:hypothetical protein LPY66_08580 [Dehalobacter sp. DCM]
MKIISGEGKLEIIYDIKLIGKDILITVTGGEEHIGSVAVGNCGTVTPYTVEGHRDDALAVPLAQEVSQMFRCICVVSAGFHRDNLSKEEISVVLENHRSGIAKVMNYLQEFFINDK